MRENPAWSVEYIGAGILHKQPFFDYMQFIADINGRYYRLTNAELLQLPAAMHPAGGQVVVAPAQRPKERVNLYTKVQKPAKIYNVGGREFSAVPF